MPYKLIRDSYWTDPKVNELNPYEKLIFLYLISNPHVHFSGVYYLPKKIISIETGISNRCVEKSLDVLIKKNFVNYNSNTIWVKNMLKHQVKEGIPNRLQLEGIKNHLKSLHNSILVNEFIDFYKLPIYTPIDTPIHTLIDNQEKEKKKENINIQEKKNYKKKEKYKGEIIRGEKQKFLDFVYLYPDEYQKLISEIGQNQTDEYIQRLNDYIGAKGIKYKSHYHTIRMWFDRDSKGISKNKPKFQGAIDWLQEEQK